MYRDIDTTSNFALLEAPLIEFWKSNKIFEKSISQRSEKDLYVFYDGPPFISGLPHHGHLLGSIAKDIIPRYWTMKGKRVERVWGWDAHGLTVENKVQKKLNIKNRKDIEKYGLDKFTKECYIYTSEVSSEWQWYVDRIGRWVDMEHAYKTTDQNYMESVMWVFKSLYDKGFIYEGVRTSLYCTACGTPVSNFEVAMDNTYKDVEDPAVTVKFKITSEGDFLGAFMLAWTTTPWTLPSNRGLVVATSATYVLVEAQDEKFILAKERLEDVFKDIPHKIHAEFDSTKLIGLKYAPLYTFYAANEKDFAVYAYKDMASTSEGVGIVHSAPGFGAVDTDMGKEFGLTLMLTIDEDGKFVKGNNGKNPFEGIYYSKANDLIMSDLKERKLVFKESTIVHRFPYHDRCNTLLIQRAQNSWFVDIQKLKNDLFTHNKNINWVPDHLKHGRFEAGIEQAPDWCISRNRFWATPMPVWESDDGDRIVVSSIKEIEELSGQRVEDLHRPFIDSITLKKNGKEYKRRPEVLDSWFEAGSMPYAQIHYPFENAQKFEKNFPGDYIVEYIAQVRAWFYVMHVLSTALFQTNSFKNVISTGVMAGSDGRKMSKTYGNYTDPKKILEEIGGDSLRLYLMASPLMLGENANFDDTELKTKSKRVLNPLWNCAKFFITFANLHNWSPAKNMESQHVLDVWIKARLQQTIGTFTKNIENYQTPPAVQALEEFADDLSRWYVRRSRDRITEGNVEALSTLYTVLVDYCKAAAPAIPFLTENIYQVLCAESATSAKQSVHLEDFPVYDADFVTQNKQLLENMDFVRKVCSLGNAARKEAGRSLRQPLSELHIVSDISDSHLSPELREIIKDELNIKSIILDATLTDQKDLVKVAESGLSVGLVSTLTEELIAEGNARELIRVLQDLRKTQGLKVSDSVEITYVETAENNSAVAAFEKEIMAKTQAISLKPGDSYALKKV